MCYSDSQEWVISWTTTRLYESRDYLVRGMGRLIEVVVNEWWFMDYKGKTGLTLCKQKTG